MNDAEARRVRALARLGVLVGEWSEQIDLPDVPAGRVSFQWTLDRQFLLQRCTIGDPNFPDSIGVIAVCDDGAGYTLHYFDSRGVVRTYAMTLDEHTWTLLRDTADFTPLHFAQRFTGTFADDGQTITAIWETRDPGKHWRKDFNVTYRRQQRH
jgi:hypothetical protein